MTIYSDGDIQKAIDTGLIVIEGLVPGSIQPASVDFHLSDRPFKVWQYHPQTLPYTRSPIVPWEDQSEEMVGLYPDHPYPYPGIGDDEVAPLAFKLDPGQFALASTTERVEIGPVIAGRLEGKSSLARLGLVVHTTAGFFDPGFKGYPTLELLNVSPRPMLLRPDMPIAQMAFFKMSNIAVVGYDKKGKYADQGADPEPSHYFENFKKYPPVPHSGFVSRPPWVPLPATHSCEWCTEGVAHTDPNHPELTERWVHALTGLRDCGDDYPGQTAWPHGMDGAHHDGGN